MAIEDFEAELVQGFPQKIIPSKSTIHRILAQSGFQILKIKTKIMIFPRNQLKRIEFCSEMVNYGPAFWGTVIWNDETTVRQMPQGEELFIRIHSSQIIE